MNADQKRICKSDMVRNVQEIATYQHTTQKLKTIMENLKQLSDKRAHSEDIKQSTDIAKIEFLKENIMKTLILLTTTTLLLALTGCGNDEKQEIKETAKEAASFKTVDYYVKHDDLRNLRLKECKLMDKMTPIEKEDCQNARKASMDKQMSKMPQWNF